MATIYDPTKEDKDQKTQATSPTGQPLQTVAMAQPGGMATPEKRPQGSGRFTNLQKYIQANQGAGQRIAGQIGQQMGGQLQEQEKQAQDYYSKLGQSVDQARKTAQQGAGFLSDLQQMGQQLDPSDATAQTTASRQIGAQDFTQSPDFAAFQAMQAGRGIDEDLLQSQQATAATGAQQFLTGAQAAQQALGTEAGRFDLLRQRFGGAIRPDYTTGQQRLDQLLFTGGGGLGGLKQDVSGRLRAAQDLARQAGGAITDVSGLAAEEQRLMGRIGDEALGLTQSYDKLLRDQMQEAIDAKAAWAPELQEQLGEGYLTQENLEKLGLADLKGMDLLDIDLMQGGYLSSPMGAPTDPWQTATDPQYQRYQALQQILSGERPEDKQVGGWTPFEFNRAQLEKDAAERLGQFKKDTGLGSTEEFLSSGHIGKNVLAEALRRATGGVELPEMPSGGWDIGKIADALVGGGGGFDAITVKDHWNQAMRELLKKKHFETRGKGPVQFGAEDVRHMVDRFEALKAPGALKHWQAGGAFSDWADAVEYRKAKEYLKHLDKYKPGRRFSEESYREKQAIRPLGGLIGGVMPRPGFVPMKKGK